MEETKFSVTKSLDLVQIAQLIFRKWFLVVLAGILAAVIGFVYSSYFITPLYRAKSTMLVDLRNSVHDDLSSEQVNVAEKYVSTFAYIMKTNTVLEPVIEELDLDETVASLAAKVQISTLEDTLLIRVSVNHPDPKTAKNIVKAIGKKAPEIINQRITSGYITEIESPTVSSSPVTPNVFKYTVLGCFLGMVLAIVLIVSVSLFDNKIKTADELRNLTELSLLGIIPSANRKNSKGA